MNPTTGMNAAAEGISRELNRPDMRASATSIGLLSFMVQYIGPEIEARDKRIEELEQQLVGKQHDFDCLRREYVAVIEGTKKTNGHIDKLMSNNMELKNQHAAVTAERDAAIERAEKIEKRYRELLDAFAKHLECGPLDGMDLHEAEETVANNYFLRMTQACELRDSLSKRAEQLQADAAAMREQNRKLMDGIANITAWLPDGGLKDVMTSLASEVSK